MRRRTVEVLRYLRADLDPDAIMGELSSGQQKTVEIAKGLVFKRKVIILDEPTASFSASEIDNLLEIIRTVKESGLGIIYISHHLEEVFRIGDRVTVLRDGRKVSHHAIAGLSKTRLIKDMVGRDPSTFYKRERVPVGEVVLEARHVTGNGVRDVSFQLRRGEVLGISGMTGSGRSELMEVLFGGAPLARRRDPAPRAAGAARLAPRRHPQPACASSPRIARTPGSSCEQTIAQNVVVANMVNTRTFLARPARTTWRSASAWSTSSSSRRATRRVRAVNLSGGNQQKVVLAKWFNTDGEIFIFDEPTRGIDVGSKQEIYQLMVEPAEGRARPSSWSRPTCPRSSP